jgi:hypothetical protein
MDPGRKRVVDDLARHAAAKMTANLHDALALLEDPEERLALTKQCVGNLLGVCAGVANHAASARAGSHGGGP